jgi:hypothetical protein
MNMLLKVLKDKYKDMIWLGQAHSNFEAKPTINPQWSRHCENHDPRVKWASKCDPTDNGSTLSI